MHIYSKLRKYLRAVGLGALDEQRPFARDGVVLEDVVFARGGLELQAAYEGRVRDL